MTVRHLECVRSMDNLIENLHKHHCSAGMGQRGSKNQKVFLLITQCVIEMFSYDDTLSFSLFSIRGFLAFITLMTINN